MNKLTKDIIKYKNTVLLLPHATDHVLLIPLFEFLILLVLYSTQKHFCRKQKLPRHAAEVPLYIQGNRL